MEEELPAEKDSYGNTQLHYACREPGTAALAMVVKLVRRKGTNLNARGRYGWAPVHYAAATRQRRILEILCVAGANLQARSNENFTPIDVALINSVAGDSYETVCVLIANGVRLNTVHETYRRYITKELVAFEWRVLQCRSAVVALLRVKRVGKLPCWDKFLLKEIAIAVWTTRYDPH